MNPKTRSIIELHIATLLLGITALFAKFITLPPQTIICIRSVITACVLAAFMKVTKDTFLLQSKKDTAMILFIGALLCLHWITYFYVLQTIPIAVAVITLFTFPVMTSLLEPFLFKEPWDYREIFSGAMIVVGVYYIVPSFSLENDITFGVGVGLFSALVFAMRNILSRKYAATYSGSALMFYQTFITGLLILPFIYSEIPTISTVHWGLLVLLGIVFTAIPHTFFPKSMTHIKAATAGIIVSLQPLYATILALLLLNEVPSVYTWIGGSLVGGAVMIETFKKTK